MIIWSWRHLRSHEKWCMVVGVRNITWIFTHYKLWITHFIYKAYAGKDMLQEAPWRILCPRDLDGCVYKWYNCNMFHAYMLYCFFTEATSWIATILLLTNIKEHSIRQDTFSTLTNKTIIQDQIMYLKYRLRDRLHMNDKWNWSYMHPIQSRF